MLTHYRLTCCKDAVSVGCPDGTDPQGVPTLQHWLNQHAGEGHALQVERLIVHPLPRRPVGKKRREKTPAQGVLLLAAAGTRGGEGM